jgi:molecular chaperone DnaK (HSP70)
MGQYLYCIIGERKRKRFGPLGMEGGKVYTVNYKDLGMVASDSPIKEYPVSRENSLIHEGVIRKVMEKYTALPVRFSTVAPDKKRIREKVLKTRYQEFQDLLEWLKGKMEVGVRAFYKDMKIVYQEILREKKEIQDFKEEISKRPRYQAHIEIGKMVESALKEKKKREEERILKRLREYASDTRVDETYGEKMFLKAALLVEREKREDFQKAIKEIEKEYEGRASFKWAIDAPPFDFVNIVIRWDVKSRGDHVPFREE